MDEGQSPDGQKKRGPGKEPRHSYKSELLLSLAVVAVDVSLL